MEYINNGRLYISGAFGRIGNRKRLLLSNASSTPLGVSISIRQLSYQAVQLKLKNDCESTLKG